MALRDKWQFMDRSVTHQIVYGPQFIIGHSIIFLLWGTNTFDNVYSVRNQYLTNCSWQWEPYGSLWTGLSPTKLYKDRSEAEIFVPGQYNVFFRILSELVFGLRYTIAKNMSSDIFVSIEYNVRNRSWHFGTNGSLWNQYLTNCSWQWEPYGSLWTGMSPTKLYKDRSEAEVHILFGGWQTGP
jgi:hypothetical protein